MKKGSDFIAAIDTKEHEVVHCTLTTPIGKVIDFDPDEKETREDKYEINISTDTKCSVIIKEVDEYDSGDWVLKYDYGDEQVDKQVYKVMVKTGEIFIIVCSYINIICSINIMIGGGLQCLLS